VLPEEGRTIKENATRTGLSVAAYLRNLGLSLDVSGTPATVLEICQLNSELESIRALLEELNRTHPTNAAFGRHVNGVLVELRKVQAALLSVAERL
jgi:hypothetical protein